MLKAWWHFRHCREWDLVGKISQWEYAFEGFILFLASYPLYVALFAYLYYEVSSFLCHVLPTPWNSASSSTGIIAVQLGLKPIKPWCNINVPSPVDFISQVLFYGNRALSRLTFRLWRSYIRGKSYLLLCRLRLRIRNSHPKLPAGGVISLPQFSHLLHEDNKRNSSWIFMIIII